jgi:hypothetical protein
MESTRLPSLFLYLLGDNFLFEVRLLAGGLRRRWVRPKERIFECSGRNVRWARKRHRHTQPVVNSFCNKRTLLGLLADYRLQTQGDNLSLDFLQNNWFEPSFEQEIR